jgi:hypothetical protein
MFKRLIAILVTVLVPLALFAVAALPVLMEQPFGSQTPKTLAAAFVMRRWSPLLAAAGAIVLLAIALTTWRRSRWVARTGFVLGLSMTIAVVWFTRQNPFEWMFNPLPDARYVPASQAAFVAPGDIVLAVRVGDDAAAYPVRQMAYHHLVNDRIGRTPAVVTY